jgi:hypothetical protein
MLLSYFWLLTQKIAVDLKIQIAKWISVSLHIKNL